MLSIIHLMILIYQDLHDQWMKISKQINEASKPIVVNPKKGREYDVLNPTNQPHIGKGNTLWFGDYYNDNPQKHNTLDSWPNIIKDYNFANGGSILGRTVTCSNCGWSWKAVDGGSDPMTCHKCGGMIKMKQGGVASNQGYYNKGMGVPQFVNGGPGDGISFFNPPRNGRLTFLEPNSSKLPIGYANIPSNVPSSELASSIGGEDGEPAFLIPTFKYGHPLEDATAEFRKTGEHLGGPFKTWQEADAWDHDVRHPYVEKGQSIPTPLRRWGKDYANGGDISIPDLQGPLLQYYYSKGGKR